MSELLRSAHKKRLNVGGHRKNIPIPAQYAGWQHDLLDIDPDCKPDVLCDAREMHKLELGYYDAIYCSHNLEHYYLHDALQVLSGFIHVLKPNGFAHIRVPDIGQLMKTVVALAQGKREVTALGFIEKPAESILREFDIKVET